MRRGRAERQQTEPGREEEIGLCMDILAYPRTATVVRADQIDRPSAETAASEYAHDSFFDREARRRRFVRKRVDLDRASAAAPGVGSSSEA